MSGRLPSTGGRGHTRRSPSPSDDDGASRSPPAVASSGTVSPANEGFNDTPSMPAFAAALPVIPTGPSGNGAESDASPAVLSPTHARPPSNVTTARRRRPREGEGSPMGSPRLTSTLSAADLRRTNSVYTVMSNDGDGYAPYVPPTELRNAIAAETQQRLELQRIRLMEGLRAAEADLPPPPLLPFVPETPGSGPAAAPPHLSPARDNLPAAAASTSIAADFLQSGFEQSYANAVASRGPATNNHHQPSITPSATPQQRPFRIQMHDMSTSQHPGDSGTTLPGALPLSHRSPFVRPAGAIALPMPPPLPTTDLDSVADITPRTHMNGSTSLANRSGGGGGSLLHAPQTPQTLNGSVSEAGLGVTAGQLRHHVPMDMDDEDDDGHAWTGSDHPAAAHDAASANPYRHGSPSSRLSQMRAGSVKSRASRKGGAHDGYSDHPYLVVRSSADDAMASSLPVEKLEPIDKLPFDVLRLILIGFVDPFTQLQCRLVSTVFDRTVTSACIMWYRRIPHHVFVAHLAHRLEHEVRLLGGPGELQIFEPDGVGINWLAAHRALAETDAAAAADEAAATAAREFRHRVPRPYLTSEEDFAALHQQHHEAHLPTFTEEDSTSPAARELLLAAADNTTQPGPEAPSSSSGRPSATETQQHFTATTAAASPWESAESSAARRIAANASPPPIFQPTVDPPGLPTQRDQDVIVVGIGASPVYADEDLHLREHSDPADIEAAERKHRRERQRRQQRLHHHHRTLPDGKFGNVPSLEDPDFDSYGITFPGSSIELIRCHTFTLLLANQLRHYRSGMPDVTAETRDRWITQSCVSGCCHRQWRLYHEQQHREQHFAQLLHERLVLSGAVLRSLVFPASDHPGIVAGLLVVTFLALFLFATLVWVGPTFGITPAVQFAPLWAFFVLLYPVLYVFFGASTIEPMVLCVLGFVGITFSAVLVYFYRIVSPFKAMSWISCSTPMLLCTSCCATYSFLVMHRFSAEVTSGRLRLVASAGCSLPALLLIFACTLALELDGTFDVRVGSVASSPVPPPVSAPPVTPVPPSGTTAAASPVPVDLGDCDGKLRFSAVVATAACGVLFGITWVATRIIKLHEIWERFPSLAAVFVAFGLAFTVGGLAGVVAFVQGPLCIPAGVTFALGSIAVIALGAAFVGSVMAATQARDVVTGPPHRMPADLVIPMECASAIIDAPSLYLRLCPTIEANAPDNQLLGD